MSEWGLKENYEHLQLQFQHLEAVGEPVSRTIEKPVGAEALWEDFERTDMLAAKRKKLSHYLGRQALRAFPRRMCENMALINTSDHLLGVTERVIAVIPATTISLYDTYMIETACRAAAMIIEEGVPEDY